jgi:glucosamine--fructose-6-phosphate aminotransferase (isomerizing)
MAGPERSVAATKSFIAALAASASLAACWKGDEALLRAIEQLPESLRRAAAIEWPEVESLAAKSESLYVLGRGPSYPIAAEMALKLKETCALHAEAYSLAEVMHGPLELLAPGFPVIALTPRDAALSTSASAVAALRRTGAEVVTLGEGGHPYAGTEHPLLEPISLIQSMYLAIERTARRRGRNPDEPAHLRKVTETL